MARRPWLLVSAATAAAVGAVAGTVTALALAPAHREIRNPPIRRVRRAHRKARRTEVSETPSQTTEPVSSLAIEDGCIVLADWNVWMRDAPVQVEDALRRGASTAEEVTIALLRRALPRHAWPPRHAHDPGWSQWRELVRIVAAHLRLPEPDPTRKLHIA